MKEPVQVVGEFAPNLDNRANKGIAKNPYNKIGLDKVDARHDAN